MVKSNPNFTSDIHSSRIKPAAQCKPHVPEYVQGKTRKLPRTQQSHQSERTSCSPPTRKYQERVESSTKERVNGVGYRTKDRSTGSRGSRSPANFAIRSIAGENAVQQHRCIRNGRRGVFSPREENRKRTTPPPPSFSRQIRLHRGVTVANARAGW